MLLDQATREREDSPSSAIGGDYAAYLERYLVESAEAFRSLSVQRHLRYGAAPRARLDFFPAPDTLHRAGLLVYFHGGYWQELSKEHFAFLAPAWHAAGFACAVVGYTLAPEARLPAIVSECRKALAWLHARADVLDFDPRNIVVAGSSAGGYLAAACGDRSSHSSPRHGVRFGYLRCGAPHRHVNQRRARTRCGGCGLARPVDRGSPVLPRGRWLG